jgi:hypothetical protein
VVSDRERRKGKAFPRKRAPAPCGRRRVFESGGDLFLAVGCTPGGAPFGPRLEIVDGELVFPDESPVDIDAVEEREDDGPEIWDRRPLDEDSPF